MDNRNVDANFNEKDNVNVGSKLKLQAFNLESEKCQFT